MFTYSMVSIYSNLKHACLATLYVNNKFVLCEHGCGELVTNINCMHGHAHIHTNTCAHIHTIEG